MKVVIVTIGIIACVLYVPALLIFFGGVLFEAVGMEPYANVMSVWGVYVIGFVLGLVADEVLG